MAEPHFEATPVTDDGRAVLTAWRRLLQAVRLRERLSERNAGLTGAQLFALGQLEAHPGATVGQLAALTVTDASSTSVVVTRLLQKGCVRRERDPVDRRRWRIHLTAEGARRLAKAPDSADKRLGIALAALTSSEREALTDQLDNLARAVEPELLSTSRSGRQTDDPVSVKKMVGMDDLLDAQIEVDRQARAKSGSLDNA